jgi:hypothetical protein
MGWVGCRRLVDAATRAQWGHRKSTAGRATARQQRTTVRPFVNYAENKSTQTHPRVQTAARERQQATNAYCTRAMRANKRARARVRAWERACMHLHALVVRSCVRAAREGGTVCCTPIRRAVR